MGWDVIEKDVEGWGSLRGLRRLRVLGWFGFGLPLGFRVRPKRLRKQSVMES